MICWAAPSATRIGVTWAFATLFIAGCAVDVEESPPPAWSMPGSGGTVARWWCSRWPFWRSLRRGRRRWVGDPTGADRVHFLVTRRRCQRKIVPGGDEPMPTQRRGQQSDQRGEHCAVGQSRRASGGFCVTRRPHGAGPAIPRSWLLTNDRATPASPVVDGGSDTAGAATQPMIMPHMLSSPIVAGHIGGRLLEHDRLGEVEGLQVSWTGAKDKITQIDTTLQRRTAATELGLPSFAGIAGRAPGPMSPQQDS
jgi:hypothetical protein